jgi:tartrate-resistant acid phosphatase type 5
MRIRIGARGARLAIVAAAIGLAAVAGCRAPSTSGVGAATSTPPLSATAPAVSSSTSGSLVPTISVPATGTRLTFAVIGDYGMGDSAEKDVADLVASWDPDFIVTTGDDYYAPAGGSGTGKYDRSTGAYYCRWLADISTTGSACRVGKSARNAFFPSLGNHDYSAAGLKTYLRYFTLPGTGFANSSGNERYYDFVEGPVHFFVLNSNTDEPDGTRDTSRQASWLREGLARSTARFNVVVDHHPPYSSDSVHGSVGYMRWPFAAWGADAVLSGHAHTYERVSRRGIVYFVNGAGGARRYGFAAPVGGSRVRYNRDWGAQKVVVTDSEMIFEFRDVSGRVIDRYRLASTETTTD